MTPTLTLERGAVAANAAPTRPQTRPQTQTQTQTQTRPETKPSNRRQLFVVATHKVRDRSAGAPNQWLPYGAEHAWEPGTRRTLCGEWITGWTVFWDRHFSARPAAACPDCVEATLPEASRRRLDHFARPTA